VKKLLTNLILIILVIDIIFSIYSFVANRKFLNEEILQIRNKLEIIKDIIETEDTPKKYAKFRTIDGLYTNKRRM